MMMTPGNEMQSLIRKVARHQAANTTHQADATMEIPIDDYVSPSVWNAEVGVFHHAPLVLGPSGDLPEPGSYKAFKVTDTPILMTRGKDGVVRAFINSCRHRGLQLVEDGVGRAARFSCAYHAWTFTAEGRLVGLLEPEMFGHFDRSLRDLIPLPCEERHGLIWGMLRPGGRLDLTQWLDGLGAALDPLGIGQWHVAERRQLDSVNWKITYDGYMEGYHFAALHRSSVAADTRGAMVLDTYGRHQRMVFAREGLRAMNVAQDSDLPPAEAVFPVHLIYPNTAIAGGLSDQMLISQIFPGETVGSCVVHMTVLSGKPLVDDSAQQQRMKSYAEYIARVIREEDFAAGKLVQSTLKAQLGRTFVLGRNEPALQHFHKRLREDRCTAEAVMQA